MGLSSAEELGRFLADVSNNQLILKEELVPNEVFQSIIISPWERVLLLERVPSRKIFYGSNSFILDHPVYGELDSSVLWLDGGYWGSEASGCLLLIDLETNPDGRTVHDYSDYGVVPLG